MKTGFTHLLRFLLLERWGDAEPEREDAWSPEDAEPELELEEELLEAEAVEEEEDDEEERSRRRRLRERRLLLRLQWQGTLIDNQHSEDEFLAKKT